MRLWIVLVASWGNWPRSGQRFVGSRFLVKTVPVRERMGCDAVTAAIHLSISPEGAGAGTSSHKSCIEAGADLCVSAGDDLRETVSWVFQQSFISFINSALKGVLLCPESRPKSHPVFSSIKSSLPGSWLHTDHRFCPHRAWLTQVVSAGPDSLCSPGTCMPAARWGGQVIACPAE